MSIKDGRKVKTRGYTRRSKRDCTKNKKWAKHPKNYFHKEDK